MIGAIMTIFMIVMMFTVKIQTGMQSACSVCRGNRFDIAFSAADNLDVCLLQCVDGSGADAAANQDIDLFGSQQVGKRAMTGFTGSKEFFADNCFFGNFKNGKAGSVSKVLENHIVSTSNCNFHFFSLSIKVQVLLPVPLLSYNRAAA